MSHWVYILYSKSTDSFYKGQTDDLPERIRRHNKGWEKATKAGIPWELVWCIHRQRFPALYNQALTELHKVGAFLFAHFLHTSI